jgi:hypothetical protein
MTERGRDICAGTTVKLVTPVPVERYSETNVNGNLGGRFRICEGS